MTATRETQYDNIIKDAVLRHFPELLTDFGPFGWLQIRAQIWQESRMDPSAVSPAGAMGLMQIMPATANELGVTDPFDPEQNINGGVSYLADQYRHMTEIPTYAERLRFALACYNGGRGNINLTLVFGRDAEGLPASFKRWRLGGRLPGRWQTWSFASSFLSDSRMPRIDYKQIRDYVARIEARYFHYLHEALDGQTQVFSVGR